MNRHELAGGIYKTSHLTGELYLRSGAVSSQYFDKYRFEGSPQLLAAVIDLLRTAAGSDPIQRGEGNE